MNPLIKLAERVEAATGPDRELDCAIMQAVNPDFQPIPGGSGFYDPALINALSAQKYITKGTYVTPRYTASIDAAMQLVPEGDDVSGEIFRLETYNKSGVLADHVRASAWVPGAPRAFAATPALAICAAALRAKASKQ